MPHQADQGPVHHHGREFHSSSLLSLHSKGQMHISTMDYPHNPEAGRAQYHHDPTQLRYFVHQHASQTCTPAVTACWQHACHRCTAATPLLIVVPCCGMHLSGALARDRRKLWHGAAPNLMWQPQRPCCLALFGVSWPARALEPLSSMQEVKLELLSSCTPLKTFMASSNSGSSQPLKQLAVSCCSH